MRAINIIPARQNTIITGATGTVATIVVCLCRIRGRSIAVQLVARTIKIKTKVKVFVKVLEKYKEFKIILKLRGELGGGGGIYAACNCDWRYKIRDTRYEMRWDM